MFLNEEIMTEIQKVELPLAKSPSNITSVLYKRPANNPDKKIYTGYIVARDIDYVGESSLKLTGYHEDGKI
jgi:hypothetical protein